VIKSITLNQTVFGCSKTPIPVLATVTDFDGNSATCTSVVKVKDLALPGPVCKTVSKVLSDEGLAQVSAAELLEPLSSGSCVQVWLRRLHFTIQLAIATDVFPSSG
jgi:hypothetical protein